MSCYKDSANILGFLSSISCKLFSVMVHLTSGKIPVNLLGLSEKELKKLAKAAEKETKSEVKVEITETSDVENDGVEDGVTTTELENQDGTAKTNKEKTFWIEYDDFWKCFRCV